MSLTCSTDIMALLGLSLCLFASVSKLLFSSVFFLLLCSQEARDDADLSFGLYNNPGTQKEEGRTGMQMKVRIFNFINHQND